MSRRIGAPPVELGERRFRADRGDHQRRLDLVVVRHLADLPISRSLAARWIEAGQVVVAGTPASRPAQRLNAGDEVEIAGVPQRRPGEPVPAEHMELAIVWEDDHLLVIDKPPGLVVHPTRGRRSGTLLNGLLGAARDWSGGQKPRTVHRLDQHTSGLLLVAKTATAQAGLGRAFQRRLIEKEYLAVVHGSPSADRGLIESPIGRDPSHARRRMVGGSAPREASTSWRVEARAPDSGSSLIACQPHTGRTHQIRVHLTSIGHPLFGDQLYCPDPPKEPGVAAGFSRQALHAWRLRLRHPVGGAWLDLVAPLPGDLEVLLAALGFDTGDSVLGSFGTRYPGGNGTLT